ncbi:class I SAM-dependent methyltransferase [Pseudobutyrivibrio xylanivorans]|uniref:Methyltransferase domain-containing protein n=1 Tax=Pseudobutyrivibrio xylanivorans TaxID=185007 RepID=A0A1G5RRM4_PSEXY|nr:class I SAM-dependent methyltransferase [Pseudobutyrivibrio xylanivorans]SCZ76081.1 Methyltransferase domain-containing protein [Pseudobutyrivibrio xylanivorans]
MLLERLYNIGYKNGRENNAYIIGTQVGLEELRNSSVYLLGAGENGFLALKLLEKEGILVQGFLDNNTNIIGNYCGEKKIYYAPDYIKSEQDIYIIICVDEKNIGGARLQLLVGGIDNYSIFFRHNCHSFYFENKNLFNAIMNGINYICFYDEKQKDALPFCGYSLGKDQSILGNVNWLLNSTEWSHPSYIYIYDYLSKNQDARILEIGPGLGLMSYVFANLFPKTNIDWILLRDEESKKTSRYEKGAAKVCTKYASRITAKYGMIEIDESIIDTDKYDLIIMTEVFEHFALYPVVTMRNLRKGLKENGKMVLSTPNWGHLTTYSSWRQLPKNSEVSKERYLELLQCGHVYQYSKEEMVDIFRESGWNIEKYDVSESNNHNFLLN